MADRDRDDFDVIPGASDLTEEEKKFCREVAKTMFYAWSGASRVLQCEEGEQARDLDTIIIELLRIYIWG